MDTRNANMKRSMCLALTVLSVGLLPAETRRSLRNVETSKNRTDEKQASLPVASDRMTDSKDTTTIKTTFTGPKNGWGFVRIPCLYYSTQGKKLGTLAGGLLFKYLDVKPTSKNWVLVSTLKRGTAWEGPYLLDSANVVVYEGNPDTVSPDLLGNLAAYFTLTGKISERQSELEQTAWAANPHYESAKQAQKLYLESISQAAEMEKQASALTGFRKTKADEALRAFKYEQVRLKSRADQEATAYRAWKDTHPVDSSTQAADPQLKALDLSLREAKAKVHDFVP